VKPLDKAAMQPRPFFYILLGSIMVSLIFGLFPQ
jgi:hypothetical protein